MPTECPTRRGGIRAERVRQLRMTPLERWNDDRLDDLAGRVSTLLRLQDKITEMEIQLVQVNGHSTQCLAEIQAVRKAQEDAERLREKREEEQRRERKSDRKWAITTLVAVLALVITALAIFGG